MSEGNPEPGSISKMTCSLTSISVCSATESLMLKKAYDKNSINAIWVSGIGVAFVY